MGRRRAAPAINAVVAGPGGDVDHVDANHRGRRIDGPGLPADIKLKRGTNIGQTRLCDPRSDGGAQLRVRIARLPRQMWHALSEMHNVLAGPAGDLKHQSAPAERVSALPGSVPCSARPLVR